jgi:hypothetical protein
MYISPKPMESIPERVCHLFIIRATHQERGPPRFKGKLNSNFSAPCRSRKVHILRALARRLKLVAKAMRTARMINSRTSAGSGL